MVNIRETVWGVSDVAVTATQILSLNFASNDDAGDSFRGLGVGSGDVGPAIGFALSGSQTKGLRLARGILTTSDDLDQTADELLQMVSWAVSEGPVAMNTIARAARLAGGGVLLVDRVSTLPAADAKLMIGEFLNSGGSLGDVTTWLATAGAVLRQTENATENLGGLIDWISDGLEDIVDALSEAVESIVDAVGSLADAIVDAVNWAADALSDLAVALLAAGRSIGEILAAAAVSGTDFLVRMGVALLGAAQLVADVLGEVADIAVGAVREVVAIAVAAGRAIADFVVWMATTAIAVVKAAVRGLLDAVGGVVSLIVDVAQLGLDLMQKVITALLEIGETFAGLIIVLAEPALDTIEVFMEAALAIGLLVGDLVVTLSTMAYDSVVKFVAAAMRAGVAVLELVGEVVGSTYWAFRRIVNGIIAATGPVGAILDAVLGVVEDFVGDGWRATLNALRFAGAQLVEVLDWTRGQAIAVLQQVLQAWEDIGEALIDVYRWAKDVAVATGDLVFEVIGRATFALRNSVTYVLGYLENDFLAGVEAFVGGLLDAGYAITDLVSRVVTHSIQVVGAAFKGALAIGVTLAELLLEVVADPANIVEHVMRALDEMEQSVADVMRAVNSAIAELADDIIVALVAVGTAMEVLVGAIWEVGGGLIGVALAAILSTIASYRPLTASERANAVLMFADSIDLTDVYISQDDLVNDLIFWVQDGFSEDPNSRAFVTFNLINFDVDDGITDATLIHELTHVWQATNNGPLYLVEAIHAQLEEALGGPDAYNYGYTNSSNGNGADAALDAAQGDFGVFNPEQQANIVKHYYVRRYEENRPQADWSSWQPYIDVVQAA